MKYKHSSFDIHVSADMTACPWKLNHGDHHVSCFYHCHTHTRFPRRRSNPRHDIPRRGHGSSDMAITDLPCLSFTDRWDPRLWVPHVSDRMVGLFVPLIPLGPTAPLPLCGRHTGQLNCGDHQLSTTDTPDWTRFACSAAVLRSVLPHHRIFIQWL